MTERYCVNCKHFSPGGLDGPECHRPLSASIDPVTGQPGDRLRAFCSVERRPGSAGIFRRRQRCGPSALFFTPKAQPQ